MQFKKSSKRNNLPFSYSRMVTTNPLPLNKPSKPSMPPAPKESSWPFQTKTTVMDISTDLPNIWASTLLTHQPSSTLVPKTKNTSTIKMKSLPKTSVHSSKESRPVKSNDSWNLQKSHNQTMPLSKSSLERPSMILSSTMKKKSWLSSTPHGADTARPSPHTSMKLPKDLPTTPTLSSLKSIQLKTKSQPSIFKDSQLLSSGVRTNLNHQLISLEKELLTVSFNGSRTTLHTNGSNQVRLLLSKLNSDLNDWDLSLFAIIFWQYKNSKILWTTLNSHKAKSKQFNSINCTATPQRHLQ